MYRVSVLFTLFPIKWPRGCVFSALETADPPQMSSSSQAPPPQMSSQAPPPPPPPAQGRAVATMSTGGKRRKPITVRCNVCSKGFSSNNKLMAHLSRHVSHSSLEGLEHLPPPRCPQEYTAASNTPFKDQLQAAGLTTQASTTPPSTQPARSTSKSFYFLLCYFSFWFMGNNGKLHHFSFNISH